MKYITFKGKRQMLVKRTAMQMARAASAGYLLSLFKATPSLCYMLKKDCRK